MLRLFFYLISVCVTGKTFPDSAGMNIFFFFGNWAFLQFCFFFLFSDCCACVYYVISFSVSRTFLHTLCCQYAQKKRPVTHIRAPFIIFNCSQHFAWPVQLQTNRNFSVNLTNIFNLLSRSIIHGFVFFVNVFCLQINNVILLTPLSVFKGKKFRTGPKEHVLLLNKFLVLRKC